LQSRKIVIPIGATTQGPVNQKGNWAISLVGYGV